MHRAYERSASPETTSLWTIPYILLAGMFFTSTVHAEASVNARIATGEEIQDITGARYKCRVVENESPYIIILFGYHRVFGPDGTYMLEGNLYADGLQYADGVVTTWPMKGTALPASASLRAAVQDYYNPVHCGAKTLSPEMFPRQTYLVDGISDLWKTDMISQTNLNGREFQVEVLRGGLVADYSGWQGAQALDPNTLFREWRILVTIDGVTYTNLYAVPDSRGAHLCWYECLNFESEFLWRSFPFKAFMWDLEIQREHEPYWRRLNEWYVRRQDDPPISYGVRLVRDESADAIQNVIEVSNDAQGGAFLPVDAVFDLSLLPASDNPPDLVVSSATVAETHSDQSMTVVAMVTNLGGSTRDPFEVGCFLSRNPQIGLDSAATGSQQVYPAGLAAGESGTFTTRIQVPDDLTTGLYYIGVFADYRGTIAELDNSNNACIAGTVMMNIIYVDDDAPAEGNGRSWITAYRYLQDALAKAGKDNEIHVAQGTYRPDRSQTTPSGSGDRRATFQLKNGVRVRGGYSGTGSFTSSPDLRDTAVYVTTLSGDLQGNDNPATALDNLGNDPTRNDNGYHVVTASYTDETAVLDGLVITGGNANGAGDDTYGGGIENYKGSFTMANCTVTRNASATHGGGMWNRMYANPTITHCAFSGNATYIDGGAMMNQGNSCPQITECRFEGNYGGYGGAIRNLNNSCPYVENCVFVGNRAGTWGGAILDSYSHTQAAISGSAFISNSAQWGGGAIWNTNDSAYRLVNCVFTNNRAPSESGGAISNASSIDVRNCTFSGNTCGKQGGAIFNNASTATLSNTIMYYNRAGTVGNQIYNMNGQSSIQYCDIEASRSPRSGQWDVLSGDDLGGNIAVDPLFVNTGSGDVHLKSQAGRWNPNAQSWIVDTVTSPCIDAGDPNCPVALEPLPNGSRINMGAYGGTAEAGKSYTLP